MTNQNLFSKIPLYFWGFTLEFDLRTYFSEVYFYLSRNQKLENEIRRQMLQERDHKKVFT